MPQPGLVLLNVGGNGAGLSKICEYFLYSNMYIRSLIINY